MALHVLVSSEGNRYKRSLIKFCTNDVIVYQSMKAMCPLVSMGGSEIFVQASSHLPLLFTSSSPLQNGALSLCPVSDSGWNHISAVLSYNAASIEKVAVSVLDLILSLFSTTFHFHLFGLFSTGSMAPSTMVY